MKKILSYYYRRFKHDLLSAAAEKGLLNANRDYQKFIILSTARTGSTLLQAYLNQHPEVFCQGEIFNTDHLKLHGNPKKIKNEQKKDVIQFLYKYGFGLHTRNLKAVGFKLFYHHFKNEKKMWEHIADDTSVMILHLKRENFLRTLVSHKIARKTNEWRAFKSSEGKEKTVSISKKELLQKQEELCEEYQKAERMFSEHKVLNISYNALRKNPEESMDEVYGFLRLDAHRIHAPGIIKQNPEPLNNLIENYEELKNESADIPDLAILFDE